jgi:arylsulfatase A-like enzyme
MKNLLILHLESIAWQHLASFRSSFPNLRQLLREAVVFDNFFSSATSTLMVVSYLFHGNDFEFDTATEFEGMKPAANNRNLFSLLADRGYHPAMICLNGFHQDKGTEFASWPDDLPPIWGTNEFPELFRRFDELTSNPP